MANQNQKLETLLNAALQATPEEFNRSSLLSTGYDAETSTWELIIKSTLPIEPFLKDYPAIAYQPLLFGYGIMRLPENLLSIVSSIPNISYIEKPKRLFFEVTQGKRSACISSLQNQNQTLYSGRDTLVAIIDTGIDYTHPEFLDENGNTRILSIWDQTLNQIYTSEVINAALNAHTTAERFAICPSTDFTGHGTHVAGIAAGNRGVAYEAKLLIVKLGAPLPNSFPSTSQLMLAIDFCLRESLRLNAPIAINLSFGNNYGAHSGTSLLETYLEEACLTSRSSIVVGTGNEGVGLGHATGTTQSPVVEFSIGPLESSISLQVWSYYWDSIQLSIETPIANENIVIPNIPGAYRFSLSRCNLFVYYGEPSPFSIFRELFVELLPKDNYLPEGIWKITGIGGTFECYLPGRNERGNLTEFLTPNPNTTLTIPSTSSRVISVGAYDAYNLTLAPFSGRGPIFGNPYAKPDLVAPGVNISSSVPGNQYEIRSGTSMATPFVTGSCSIMMQWGIVEKNDPFLYGDKIKAYLCAGCNPLPAYTSYPNPDVGFGALCLRKSLP